MMQLFLSYSLKVKPPLLLIEVGEGVDAVVGSSGANVFATPVPRMSFSFSSKVSNLVFNQAL